MNYFRPYHNMNPRTKNPLSEINTGQISMYTKHRMNGDIETRFHVNIIDMLDQIFIHDALKYSSIEQERFFKVFFDQAGIATDILQLQSTASNSLNSNACDNIKGSTDSELQEILDLDPYEHMETVFKELDNYLGAYRGQKDGRYKR